MPIFLGIQSSPESVADYKIINGITGIVTAMTGMFLSVLLPSSSKVIANNDRESYDRIAYQGTKYLTAFTGFCVFGLMVVAKDVLIIYVGDSFLYLLPWLYVMLFLMITSHILCLSSLILGGSDIKPLSRMTAVSSIIALITAWLTIPKYEVGGVVIGTIVYNVAQMLFYYSYYLPRILKVNSKQILFRYVVPVTIVGLIMWLVIICIPHFESYWISTFALGALFTLLYGVFMIVYLNKSDKQFILKLVRSRRKGD